MNFVLDLSSMTGLLELTPLLLEKQSFGEESADGVVGFGVVAINHHQQLFPELDSE